MKKNLDIPFDTPLRGTQGERIKNIVLLGNTLFLKIQQILEIKF